jgi:hypothetical protein
MTISPRLLFLSFLGFGLVTGLFVGSLSHAIAAGPETSTQSNTLFVIVDDLASEHPALQGIWLAARGEDSSEVNWMPVYPAPLDETNNEFAKPHSAFYLPSNTFEDVNALPPLRSGNLWWDEIFWLDEAALSALQSASGAEATALNDTWLEPQSALFDQVQVLNALCTAGQQGSRGLLDQLLALMPGHMRQTVNPFELITRWDQWSLSGFALSCIHPWAN